MKQGEFRRYPNLTDEEMVVLFQDMKDMEILGSLYNRYLLMMMGLCLKYLNHQDAAEDAVMEIFEILHRRLPNHQVENFSAWLYRLASNHCLDILRKQQRDLAHNVQIMQSVKDERHTDNWLMDEVQEKEAVLARMENCLGQLNEKQKLSIELFYLKKQSYEQVSKKLGATWAQTRSYIQNGRRNMKKCMEQNESN